MKDELVSDATWAVCSEETADSSILKSNLFPVQLNS